MAKNQQCDTAKRWLFVASKMQQLTRESALPNHLQLSLSVPLPLPAPGSAPVINILRY